MHILLVEDERSLATYVHRGLSEAGYAVDVAYTAQEAQDWLATSTFDIILLDVLLPDGNGLTLCREIRQRRLPVAILMLTARDTVDDRILGLDAGADDYVIKPFALPEVIARLRALSRRPRDAPHAPVLTIGDLTLDPRTRQAQRQGTSLVLTAKEYGVLECLMRQSPRIVTRTMIMDQVWSYDVLHESNIVDVYIRNLRRKIDDPYTIPLIHTIRGMGYRLAVDTDELAAS